MVGFDCGYWDVWVFVFFEGLWWGVGFFVGYGVGFLWVVGGLVFVLCVVLFFGDLFDFG